VDDNTQESSLTRLTWAGLVTPSSNSRPSRRRESPPARGRPQRGAKVLLGIPTRMGEQMGQSPVVGEDKSPRVHVEATDGKISAPDSPRAPRRSGDVRIRRRGHDAVGLVQEEVHGVLGRRRNDPSTQMTWRSGSTRLPSSATRPSIVTRPSLMRISQDRRDPNPARARVFCRRSPSSNYETSELSSTSKPISSTSRLAVSIGGMNSSIGGRSSSAARPIPVEEEFGRAIEDGLARSPGATFFFDVLALLEESTHAVNVHAAKRGDLGARIGCR